jgi:hypothetical protein
MAAPFSSDAGLIAFAISQPENTIAVLMVSFLRQGRAGGSIDILRSDIFSIKNNSSNISPDVFMPMYWHGSLFDFRTK